MCINSKTCWQYFQRINTAQCSLSQHSLAGYNSVDGNSYLVLSFVFSVMRSRIFPSDQGEIYPFISPSSVDLKLASCYISSFCIQGWRRQRLLSLLTLGVAALANTPSMLPKLALLPMEGQAYVLAGAPCPLPLLLVTPCH